MSEDGERSLVAARWVGDVPHVAFAYYDGPTVDGRSWGSCSCGWRTEATAPAALTWPAVRLHVLEAGLPASAVEAHEQIAAALRQVRQDLP